MFTIKSALGNMSESNEFRFENNLKLILVLGNIELSLIHRFFPVWIGNFAVVKKLETWQYYLLLDTWFKNRSNREQSWAVVSLSFRRTFHIWSWIRNAEAEEEYCYSGRREEGYKCNQNENKEKQRTGHWNDLSSFKWKHEGLKSQK